MNWSDLKSTNLDVQLEFCITSPELLCTAVRHRIKSEDVAKSFMPQREVVGRL